MLRLLKDATVVGDVKDLKEIGEVITPIVLTPARVVEMLEARDKYQVVKFRSTCSDCVPNL